jgi:hypothetical protein
VGVGTLRRTDAAGQWAAAWPSEPARAYHHDLSTGQQAGQKQSGSELPHSMALPPPGCL